MYLSSSPSSLNISYFWKKEQDLTAFHQNLSSCSPSFPLLPRLCMPLSNCCHPPHLPNISINNVNTLLLGQALSLTGALLCIFPVRYVYTEDLCPGRHAEFVQLSSLHQITAGRRFKREKGKALCCNNRLKTPKLLLFFSLHSVTQIISALQKINNKSVLQQVYKFEVLNLAGR